MIGVGIEGDNIPEILNGVHWVYFPEEEYIFYRVTVLSNFSPRMVPKPYKQWSLLIEVSESKHRRVPASREKLREMVKEGLLRSGMLPADAKIVAIWDRRIEYGYPVPYVERNMHVHAADHELRKLGARPSFDSCVRVGSTRCPLSGMERVAFARDFGYSRN